MAEHAAFSEGARYDRRATRGYLKRQIRQCDVEDEKRTTCGPTDLSRGRRQAFSEALQWILKRQQRYDRRKGGLGRDAQSRPVKKAR